MHLPCSLSHIFVIPLPELYTVLGCDSDFHAELSTRIDLLNFPATPLLCFLPCFCGLPHLRHTTLPPLLRGLRSGLGIHDLIPPPETAGVVANEFLVVNIVPLGSAPAG